MESGKIDYSSLESAIAQLKKSIDYSESDLAHSDPELFHQFRNSVIQCFEFTYELSWKMLKRRLEADMPSPSEIDPYSYKQLIRTGAEMGLLQNPEDWFLFRELRNQTAHAYSESKANLVYSNAPKLYVASNELWKNLVK